MFATRPASPASPLDGDVRQRAGALRRISVGVVLGAAACFLLAACATSAGTTTSKTATSTVASDATVSASTSISKAQADRYAREVNLTQADVPGSEVLAGEQEIGIPTAGGVAFDRCIGAVLPNRRVDNVDSERLRLGSKSTAIGLKSNVEVQPSATVADKDFAALQGAHTTACLKHQLPKSVEATSASDFHIHLGAIRTTAEPGSLPSGLPTYGVLIEVPLTVTSKLGKQVKRIVYADIVAFVIGPAEISLSTTSITRQRTFATAKRLLTLLYQRADAHKL